MMKSLLKIALQILLVLTTMSIAVAKAEPPTWQLSYHNVSVNPRGKLTQFICTRGSASTINLSANQQEIKLNALHTRITVLNTFISTPVKGLEVIQRQMLVQFDLRGVKHSHIMYFQGLKPLSSSEERGFFYDNDCYGNYRILGEVTNETWNT